jgi:hypothetical protein
VVRCANPCGSCLAVSEIRHNAKRRIISSQALNLALSFHWGLIKTACGMINCSASVWLLGLLFKR